MELHAPDGIFPPANSKGPTLQFKAIRRTYMAGWGIAQVLLLDGKADEAAALLLSLLRATYHLQKGGTTLVTQMIAIVCLKGTYSRLELVLDAPALSPAIRQEIGKAVRSAPPMKEVVENAFLGEHVIARSSMDEMSKNYAAVQEAIGWMRSSNGADPSGDSRLMACLLFNRKRTEREYSAFLDQVCSMVIRRELVDGQNATAALQTRLERWKFKNPAGKELMASVVPAFAKVSAEWWRVDDQRNALRQRLETE